MFNVTNGGNTESHPVRQGVLALTVGCDLDYCRATAELGGPTFKLQFKSSLTM